MNQQQVSDIKVLDTLVAGKNLILTIQQNSTVLKPYSVNEWDFYNYIYSSQIKQSSPQKTLRKFIPIYKGIVQIQIPQKLDYKNEWTKYMIQTKKLRGKHKYIKLENQTKNYKNPCTMDIKLGKRNIYKPKNILCQNSTTFTHNFRICGMRVCQSKNGEIIFKDKYYHRTLTVNEIQINLGLFFFDGQKISKKILEKSLQELDNIIKCLKQLNGYEIDSLSLLIIYNSDLFEDIQSVKLKLIDFDRFKIIKDCKPDYNRIMGLENLKYFLLSVYQKNQIYNKQLRQLFSH